MLKLRKPLSGACAAALLASPALGVDFVNEDFESYTSTAEMQAVWGNTGLGTLETGFAAPVIGGNNDAFHPGGAVNNRTDFGTVDATATENLVLEALIYDPGSGVDNDRVTVGLRGGPFPLFEMGRWNNTAHYAVRVNTMGNGIGTAADPNNPESGGWVNFEVEVFNEETQENELVPLPSSPGWHQYKAVFSITDGITVTIDRADPVDGTLDGIPESTLTFAGDGTTAFGGFSDLRFGGPSNVSSVDFAAFDNIRLYSEAVAAGFIDGDYNGDGFVSQADLDLVLLNWGAAAVPAEWLATEQFDNVQVSQNELDGVLLNWGSGTPPTSVNAVPEPASLVLLGLGGLALATRRR